MEKLSGKKRRFEMLKKVLLFGIAFIFLAGSICLAGEVKIGFIDYRKVFYEFNRTKKFQEELAKKDEVARKEFDRKTEEIRKLRDEMELLSEKAKEEKQAEIRQKSIELDAFRRKKGDELLRWRDSMIKNIHEDITKKIKDFARKNGYDFIIDSMAVIYGNESYNATDKVIKEINK